MSAGGTPHRWPPLILLGAGGHARVVAELLARLHGVRLLGCTSPDLPRDALAWGRLPVLGDDAAVLARHDPAEVVLANGVGMVAPPGVARRRLYDTFRARGFHFPPLVHPAAVVAADAQLAAGAQVMAGAVVQSGARVGENALINTRAVVDHDTLVGAHAHVASGAVLCGAVRVGEGVLIGAGATVIQGVTVGAGALVAAGAAVVAALPPGARVGGVPARPLRPGRGP